MTILTSVRCLLQNPIQFISLTVLRTDILSVLNLKGNKKSPFLLLTLYFYQYVQPLATLTVGNKDGLRYHAGFPGCSVVKNPPAVQETRVLSLSWEDPQRSKWQPTPVLLPEKFHGQRSLVGYSPWGHKELDTTEQLSTPRQGLICLSVQVSYNTNHFISHLAFSLFSVGMYASCCVVWLLHLTGCALLLHVNGRPVVCSFLFNLLLDDLYPFTLAYQASETHTQWLTDSRTRSLGFVVLPLLVPQLWQFINLCVSVYSSAKCGMFPLRKMCYEDNTVRTQKGLRTVSGM